MLALRVQVVEMLMAKCGPDSPAMRDAKFSSFSHAAAKIRKTAQAKIKRGPKEERQGAKRRQGRRVRRARHQPAPAGQPIRTQSGRARRSIVYAADHEGAVIGPRYSVMGESMSAHEHGGSYMGADYPQRPTMGPALAENEDRFAEDWQGSFGE